jgi:hypothetical protein
MGEEVTVEYRQQPLGVEPFTPPWDVGVARVRTDPILRPSEVEMVPPEEAAAAQATVSAVTSGPVVATCAPPPST